MVEACCPRLGSDCADVGRRRPWRKRAALDGAGRGRSGVARSVGAMSSLPDPELVFAFEARVDTGEMITAERAPSDTLMLFPITGGTVTGRLNGKVLAQGGDWATWRGGDTIELEARYLIETDDGAVIEILNRGFHVASPEVNARLDSGEDVPETEYYYRTSPIIRTNAPQHEWLSRTVFIGMARSERGQVCIRFFELL